MAEAKAETQAAVPEPQDAAKVADGVKMFSREEVSKHNTEEDLYIIIQGKVYSVAKYLDNHPGGPEIIADVAGQDATDEFLDTGHTAEAREELKKYYIGEVEGGDLTRTSDSRSSEGPSMLMMIAVLAILFAIFVAMKFQS
mmetsp:Transcript_22112/g.43523  ORF Transcript_22112/g.43523 Transcript_22112/m.43523 type:complete len:141 (+) Transcript_22112:30-452(+)